jgi:hypothetical protein
MTEAMCRRCNAAHPGLGHDVHKQRDEEPRCACRGYASTNVCDRKKN